MEISPIHFTFEPRRIMNNPPLDKNFYIKYLQNVDYSKEPTKVEKTKVIGSSDVEKKVEKGQWPPGYYGNFLVVHPFYYYREEIPDYTVHAIERIYRTPRISETPKNPFERYKRNIDAHNRAINNEQISGKGNNIDRKV